MEPFIDTIVICTMTGLVIIMTGVWSARIPTEITLGGGDISYLMQQENGNYTSVQEAGTITLEDGRHTEATDPQVAWHEVPVDALYVDSDQTQPFTGTVLADSAVAIALDGTTYTSLYADAVESGAPLTMLAFERGLPGTFGKFIVVLSVLLFAVSTAIAWSYYGDRCANYLFGHSAVLPYKFAFVTMHFVGSVLSLSVAWTLGDVFLGIVILPNLLALLLLAPKVVELTRSYFQRRPWVENREARLRYLEQKRSGRG